MPSMTSGRSLFRFPTLGVLFFLVGALSACGVDSPTDPGLPDPTEVGVVVNSVEISLSVFPLDDPAAVRTIPLGPEGTPVGASLRGELALVPMGIVPVAVVVDLKEGRVLRSIALPAGSQATGSAFLNDSIALVANPGRNSVSVVNVRSGIVGGEIATGRYPQAILVTGEKVFIVNGELENFAPVGKGTVTVLDANSLQRRSTIQLSGENSGSVSLLSSGQLLVVNSGSWGADNGSLSVVAVGAESEIDVIEGFGNFPGTVATDSQRRVFVSSWSFGVVVWNSVSGAWERGVAQALTPGGVGSAAGVGVDREGRVYVLSPECQGPGRIHRFTPALVEDLTVPVGICASSIGFTSIPGDDAAVSSPF